jgi:hypothetical protein
MIFGLAHNLRQHIQDEHFMNWPDPHPRGAVHAGWPGAVPIWQKEAYFGFHDPPGLSKCEVFSIRAIAARPSFMLKRNASYLKFSSRVHDAISTKRVSPKSAHPSS